MTVNVSYWVLIMLRRVLTVVFLRRGLFFEKIYKLCMGRLTIVAERWRDG